MQSIRDLPRTPALNCWRRKLLYGLMRWRKIVLDWSKKVFSLTSAMCKKTNRLVLTDASQTPNLRKWMVLVRKLQGEDLSIRIIGFLVKGVRTNLDQQLKLLNLSRATTTYWVNAHNQNSRSALNHLAIDIVCRLDRKRDLSFSAPRPFAMRWPLQPSHRFGGSQNIRSRRRLTPQSILGRQVEFRRSFNSLCLPEFSSYL